MGYRVTQVRDDGMGTRSFSDFEYSTRFKWPIAYRYFWGQLLFGNFNRIKNLGKLSRSRRSYCPFCKLFTTLPSTSYILPKICWCFTSNYQFNKIQRFRTIKITWKLSKFIPTVNHISLNSIQHKLQTNFLPSAPSIHRSSKSDKRNELPIYLNCIQIIAK